MPRRGRPAPPLPPHASASVVPRASPSSAAILFCAAPSGAAGGRAALRALLRAHPAARDVLCRPCRRSLASGGCVPAAAAAADFGLFPVCVFKPFRPPRKMTPASTQPHHTRGVLCPIAARSARRPACPAACLLMHRPAAIVCRCRATKGGVMGWVDSFPAFSDSLCCGSSCLTRLPARLLSPPHCSLTKSAVLACCA